MKNATTMGIAAILTDNDDNYGKDHDGTCGNDEERNGNRNDDMNAETVRFGYLARKEPQHTIHTTGSQASRLPLGEVVDDSSSRSCSRCQ